MRPAWARCKWGDGKPDPVRGGHAQTGGQPGQKPVRAAQGLLVSGIPDRSARKGGVDGQGPSTLQAAGEGNHPPKPRAPGAGRHRRTAALCQRLAQLLRHQPHLQGGAGTGGMAAEKSEVVLLEAMEAGPHAKAKPDQAGCRSGGSQISLAQSQRLLADELQPHPATSAHQPLAGGTWSP